MIVWRRKVAAVLAIGVAAAVALAGCSGSSANNGTSSSTAVSKPATGSGSSPNSSPSGSPSGSGAPADAATKAAVSGAYATFFNPKTSAARSEAVLQHGASFRKTLAEQAATAQSQNVSATVSKVSRTGPDVAAVTFTLLSGGSPLLTDTPGFAVREGGVWKVAAQTFCGLLQLQGGAPAACKDTSITALPG
jgi:hypothetical protein